MTAAGGASPSRSGCGHAKLVFCAGVNPTATRLADLSCKEDRIKLGK
jgi:hypothetical protein